MDILTLATSVTPDRSLGFTGTVIIAGLGIVIATLLVLIVVFYIFGAVVSKTQQAAKAKANKKLKKQIEEDMQKEMQQLTSAAPVERDVVQSGISGEVVAAISAAVYSMEGEGAVIRSITRKKNPITERNPWANAGVIDNTRAF